LVAGDLLQAFHDGELEVSQFAVGDDDEVAAAAGGVHVADAAELVAELAQPVGFVLAEGLDVFELGAELVEEERVEGLEDVLFGGVVLAELPAGLGVAHGLEHRAEDGWADGLPVPVARVEHRGTELGVETRAG
jgi:hypothetical protein